MAEPSFDILINQIDSKKNCQDKRHERDYGKRQADRNLPGLPHGEGACSRYYGNGAKQGKKDKSDKNLVPHAADKRYLCYLKKRKGVSMNPFSLKFFQDS